LEYQAVAPIRSAAAGVDCSFGRIYNTFHPVRSPVMVKLAKLAAALLFGGAIIGCQPPPGQQPNRPKITPQPQPQAQRPQPGARPPNTVTARAGEGTQANFEIHLDRAAMAAAKVEASAVTDSLTRFFNAYPYFSLIDLQELKIKSAEGKDVPLRQVGTIDVWFGPAKTEIVIGGSK
jgi:hypothetical protein